MGLFHTNHFLYLSCIVNGLAFFQKGGGGGGGQNSLRGVRLFFFLNPKGGIYYCFSNRGVDIKWDSAILTRTIMLT